MLKNAQRKQCIYLPRIQQPLDVHFDKKPKESTSGNAVQAVVYFCVPHLESVSLGAEEVKLGSRITLSSGEILVLVSLLSVAPSRAPCSPCSCRRLTNNSSHACYQELFLLERAQLPALLNLKIKRERLRLQQRKLQQPFLLHLKLFKERNEHRPCAYTYEGAFNANSSNSRETTTQLTWTATLKWRAGMFSHRPATVLVN